MTTDLQKIEHVPPSDFSETAFLIREAYERGVDASGLYAILSEERADRRKMAFNEAFAKFQAEVPPTVKRSRKQISERGASSSYATLEDIRSHVDPYLRKHGLALSYGTKMVDGHLFCSVKLSHTSGHEEERFVPFKADKPTKAMNDVQAIGSGQTYAMRYATVGILGLWFVDQDDDGHAAGGRQPFTPPDTIDEDQIRILNDLLIERLDAFNATLPQGSQVRSIEHVREPFTRAYGISTVAELPKDKFDEACERLHRPIGARP